MIKEKIEDLKFLFSLIELELVTKDIIDGKIYWEFMPSKTIDNICEKQGNVEAAFQEKIGIYDIMLTSIEDIEHALLHVKEFWWTAIKKDNDGNLLPKDKGRGIIILKNPFCGCNSIEEAQIKADVSGRNSLLSFSFVYDPVPATAIATSF